MRTTLWAAALSVAACLPVVAAEPEAIRLTAQPDLSWEVTPEGVAFAPLKGDRFEESYMAMVRLPAGLVSPVHVKSASMFGLVVSGEMVHTSEADAAEAAKVLKAGDYYEIPAGLPHQSKCVSNVECVTFLYQDGPFDFLPLEEKRQ
ncbi:cupin domain-containing protein [Roseibium sp. Sym1]|uniref:cupin domain-containing protein n=1 Tax=Roseibium sp. Sym1 TaxID=3016006 RepID=UPI0022B46B39|nr:cupin domain-containing protein [Roseibium sp. Sym1]